jgi:hypothetical protein
VEKIWKEWRDGLEGFMSVQPMEQLLEHNYRFDNDTIKVERCRRKKIIDMVERVMVVHPKWGEQKSVAFVARELRSKELRISSVHKALVGPKGQVEADRIVAAAIKAR